MVAKTSVFNLKSWKRGGSLDEESGVQCFESVLFALSSFGTFRIQVIPKQSQV